jgi:hypothetical protein
VWLRVSGHVLVSVPVLVLVGVLVPVLVPVLVHSLQSQPLLVHAPAL